MKDAGSGLIDTSRPGKQKKNCFAMNLRRIVLKNEADKNNKARLFIAGLCYMDGLVSTGNQVSLHNIKNNFS